MAKMMVNGAVIGATPFVDQELSTTSLNPLTNKATSEALNTKLDKSNPTGTGSFSLNRASGTTVGDYSFAEGYDTTASDHASHAEGDDTTASGYASHSEGDDTTASAHASHSEGQYTTASGYASHAEGYKITASGNYSHVQGKFNVEDTANKYAHIVGGGRNDDNRKNIHTLDWSGNAEFAGDVSSTDSSGNKVSLNSLNSDVGKIEVLLTKKDTEIKMLGWNVPDDFPIQNTVNGNQFIQRVGRVALSALSWAYNATYTMMYATLPITPKANGSKYATPQTYNTWDWTIGQSGWYDGCIYETNSGYTNITDFVNKLKTDNAYLYYELATPITKTIDGNEAITQLSSDLANKYELLAHSDNISNALSYDKKKYKAILVTCYRSDETYMRDNAIHLIGIGNERSMMQLGVWQYNAIYTAKIDLTITDSTVKMEYMELGSGWGSATIYCDVYGIY